MLYIHLAYATYYISLNGSDESTCGDTRDTTSRTLQHVFSLYYNISSQSGLEIITSKSLIVDQHLIVRLYSQYSINTRMPSRRMRTARSLTVPHREKKPRTPPVSNHAPPVSNHTCPPMSNHTRPRATLHAPPEQPRMPPHEQPHMPPHEQPCMPPHEQPCMSPREQPCTPPMSNHARPPHEQVRRNAF